MGPSSGQPLNQGISSCTICNTALSTYSLQEDPNTIIFNSQRRVSVSSQRHPLHHQKPGHTPRHPVMPTLLSRSNHRDSPPGGRRQKKNMGNLLLLGLITSQRCFNVMPVFYQHLTCVLSKSNAPFKKISFDAQAINGIRLNRFYRLPQLIH